MSSSGPNYAMAFQKKLATNDMNQNIPHFSDGTAFLAYKNLGGGRFSQNQATSLSVSGLKQQANLPSETTMFRNFVTNDALGVGNESLKNWVFTTQTLSNPSTDNTFCTSDADCSQFSPDHKCNSNYQNWNDAAGNQSGSFCTVTKYPELEGSVYNRKLTNEGGIGKNCHTDSDCNTSAGYFCNNTTNTFGSNIQQNGFCAMKYSCDDGEKERFLGYPYNSAVPLAPSRTQNNGGQGYTTKEECQHYAAAQQHCVQMKVTDADGNETSGNYFATYPGFCPQPAVLRKNKVMGTGALRASNMQQLDKGFVVPGIGMSLPSNMGSKPAAQSGPVGAFVWNLKNRYQSDTGLSEPFMYQLKQNPRP